jgi:hypothetical protein
MLDIYIEEVRKELNSLVKEEGADFCQGKILTLSQKLDKLIFVKQTLEIQRLKIHYVEKLRSFVSSDLLII